VQLESDEESSERLKVPWKFHRAAGIMHSCLAAWRLPASCSAAFLHVPGVCDLFSAELVFLGGKGADSEQPLEHFQKERLAPLLPTVRAVVILVRQVDSLRSGFPLLLDSRFPTLSKVAGSLGSIYPPRPVRLET
jgi:hypothetical protein